MSDRVSGGSGSQAAAVQPTFAPRRRIFSLVVHGKEIFLRPGTHTIGRALSCDIVVNDRLVSREHARLIVRDTTATVVDLGSTNGSYVNESRVQGSCELRDADLVIIGSEEMTLRAVTSDDERTTSPGPAPESGEEISEVIERDPPSSSRVAVQQEAPVSATVGTFRASIGSIRIADARSDSAPHLTEKADALQVLGRLADRAMVMGNYDAAEHVLESHLNALLVAARNGLDVPDAQRETASRYALRLADALQKPGWIDFAVELHLIASKPMSEWCTSRLLLVATQVAGTDLEQFFFYQQMLKGTLERMTPVERVFAGQIVDLQPRR